MRRASEAAVTVASLGDAALWDAIHAESGVASHARSIAAALSLSGIQPRLARVALGNARLVLPFHERMFGGLVDVCTWLSVAGAWARPPLTALVDAWDAHARRQGWVASYIQLEPVSDVSDLPQAIRGNELFLVDFASRPPRAGFAHRVERHVRRAERAGTRLVEDRATLAEALLHHYPQAMARAGASTVYSLSAATLHALAMSPDCLVLGASCGGEVEIVWVFPVTGERAENFVQAGSVSGRSLAAWLYWKMMERLRARGVRWLNLGGGVRGGDGVEQFKSWLGGVRHPLHALRLVHDEAAYAALCASADVDRGARWFPAYHDPALLPQAGSGPDRRPSEGGHAIP